MRLDNHIDIAYNDDNIFTSSKLYPDPLYDPNENKTWWELHWFEFIQNLVFTIALLVSVVLAACGHPQMLIFCINAALSAAVSGAIIAGAITAYKGGDTKDVQYALNQGFVDGARGGFTVAAITYGLSVVDVYRNIEKSYGLNLYTSIEFVTCLVFSIIFGYKAYVVANNNIMYGLLPFCASFLGFIFSFNIIWLYQNFIIKKYKLFDFEE